MNVQVFNKPFAKSFWLQTAVLVAMEQNSTPDRWTNVMDDKATEFEQQTKQRLNLAYEISDEVLESAAMVPGITRNYTLTFCSTPWTCPMSHVQVMQPLGGDPRAAASNATALL